MREIRFEWVDAFAAARNEALSHATGDYTFWLDADDVVEPGEREKLRALLDGLVRPHLQSEASLARTGSNTAPGDCSLDRLARIDYAGDYQKPVPE